MRTKEQIRQIISDPKAFEDRLDGEPKEFYGSQQEAFDHDKGLMRQLINELDDEIAECLQLRQRVVDVLHLLKENNDESIKDSTREDEIKDRLIREYPEMQETIEKLYNFLFDQDTI